MAYFLGKGAGPMVDQNPYSRTNPQGEPRTLSNQGDPPASDIGDPPVRDMSVPHDEEVNECKQRCQGALTMEDYNECIRRCEENPDHNREDPPDEPVDPNVPGGKGEGCAGGHRLTNEFIGGKGQGSAIWQDPHGIIPAKYTRSSDWEAHRVYDPQTGRYYTVEALYKHYESGAPFPSGQRKACRKGFKRQGDWCCPDTRLDGDEESDVTPMGEFKWPAEMYSLYSSLMNRGNEFMNRTPGFSQDYMDTTFGRNFDVIRGAGDAARQQTMGTLQREGLAGTGASQDTAADLAWGTESTVGNLIRDLFVLNEEQRRKDTLDFTRAGQDILGGGMGFWGMEEDINAGRRGEQQANIAMFLQYLTSLMSSWR